MLFDSVLYDKSNDSDVPRLSNSMSTILGLFIVMWVETRIENNNNVRTRKIDPKTA